MKLLAIVGGVLVLLGVLSFVVPIPHTEDHSVKIGGARFGVQTHSSDKLPPAASFTLIAVGAVALVLASRK